MRRRAFLSTAGTALALAACSEQRTDPPQVLVLNVGVLLLLRHAKTEGLDEAAVKVVSGDCAAQPKLSAEGVDQARQLRLFLRDARLRPHAVLTSPACPCRETARLLFGSEVALDTDLLPLDGLDEEQVAERVAALGALAEGARREGRLVASVGHADLPVAAGLPKPEEGGGLLLWWGGDSLELLGTLHPAPYRLEAAD